MTLGRPRVSPERVAKGFILLGVVYPVIWSGFYGPDNTYSLIAGFVVLVTLWRFRAYFLDGQFVDNMVFCLSTILGVIVGIGGGNIAATVLPLFPGFNHVAGLFLSTVCIITLMLSLIDARVASAFSQGKYISLIRVFALGSALFLIANAALETYDVARLDPRKGTLPYRWTHDRDWFVSNAAQIVLFLFFGIGTRWLVVNLLPIAARLRGPLRRSLDRFVAVWPSVRDILSPTLFFSLLYAAIVLWFGSMLFMINVLGGGHDFSGTSRGTTWWSFVYLSMTTFPPLGNSPIQPSSRIAQAVLIAELLVGTAWVGIVLTAVVGSRQQGRTPGVARRRGRRRSAVTVRRPFGRQRRLRRPRRSRVRSCRD